MPNWCTTDFVFIGLKEEIKSFKKTIEYCTSHSYVKNSFGDNWLGNIVIHEGEDYNKVHCRGEITFMSEVYDNDDDENFANFELQTWTAWEPYFNVFNLVLRHFPSIQYYFYAEEPGCELYLTNDPKMNNFYLEYNKQEHGYLSFKEGERPTDEWKEEDLNHVN